MAAEPEQHPDRPSPPPGLPRGVPRWLWPPPGAKVSAAVIAECVAHEAGSQTLVYRAEDGAAPADQHLRALRWLLDEHPRAPRPTAGGPAELRVRLEIAATPLPGGRVGHAYAINGGPLGAPSSDPARGLLWRYIQVRVGV